MIQEADVKLTTYRLFWTNGSGRIASVPDTVDAYDDDEAVQEAEKVAQGRKVEIWERSRQVAALNGSERL